MTNYALITSAGKGKRMNAKMNKLLMLLNGEPILAKTLRKFQDCKRIGKIIVVANHHDREEIEGLCKEFSKVQEVVTGGEERQHSVHNGLKAITGSDDDIVVIHNGANPMVDEGTIIRCIEAAGEHGAAVCGFKARDTIKEVDEGFVRKTLDRQRLWQVQTPQAINLGLAKEAFEKASAEEYIGTDDVMLVERLGKKVKMVECPPDNIKITLPNDLSLANDMHSRIGFGMDSHRFSEKEKPLMLGGVKFDGMGFEGNSDADVLLHALFNAVSSGIGEKSISYYSDPMCKSGVTDSKEYLKVILKMMKERGYSIGNIAVMLEGKRPMIAGKEDSIKESLAGLTGIKAHRIGITATSGEELSDFGKGLGMQCFCVVSLRKE
ncbi:MAG: 2-C-methyl-D-erythritol 4-phosphate cytidylyltransferase [Nanoarchaeota archaeon]|nr:2-C-methyl-D-erythritol 4-phosphate cytidylyltransferase [Nanoarchaeota archaeon]